MGSNSSCFFPLALRNWASLSGASWRFHWTQVPFSLASFFFWSFSFTGFRKLSWLLKCLNVLHTHINSLGKNLAVNLFPAVPTSYWVTLQSLPFCHGDICVACLFQQCPFPIKDTVYNITFFVDSHECGWKINSVFSKRPGKHYEHVPSSFPLCWSFWWITGRWWMPAEKKHCLNIH